MNWNHYRDQILKKAGNQLPANWHEIDGYQTWGNWSLGDLWSWRGAQCQKWLGYMPTPEEIGIEADHPFFNPDYISISTRTFSNGESEIIGWFHHGRKIRPGERLFPTKADAELQQHPRRIARLSTRKGRKATPKKPKSI